MKIKTKINLFFINFLLIGNGILFSQELPTIVTDRPDITESAETVQKNRFQIESGILNNRDQGSYYDSLNQVVYFTKEFLTLPNVLFRYGVNDFMELRLALSVTISNEDYNGKYENSSITNFDAPSFGFKFKLGKQDGIEPSIAVIIQAVSPVLSTESVDDYIDPSIVFCFQNIVSDNFSLGYNAGLNLQDWFGEGDGFFLSLSGSYSFSEKVLAFGELFSSTNFYYLVPNIGGDLGVTYLVSNNIQLDLSGGASLENIKDDYFFSTGFSIRIPN
ncbi:MAG: transporter [Ignavibacteria bacterium]